MMPPDFTAIEGLMGKGEYTEAYARLSALNVGNELSLSDRADVLHSLGTVIRCVPALGTQDECGLSYFKDALSVVPSHKWAAIDLLGTYGEHFPDHQDVRAVRDAIKTLETHFPHDPDAANAISRARRLLSCLGEASEP